MTAGTLLEHTRVPMRMWLEACWQVTATKVGLSALSLQRMTGVTYPTAWSMLHRLRAAMDQTGRERLVGDVEVDETYVGGRQEGARGRSRSNKEVVVVACERASPAAMGRIRVARAPDASAVALRRFIEANIEPGSVLLTDAWAGYPTAIAALTADGLAYTHKVENLSQSVDHAHVVFPHVHRVAALLKRWLLGTHQGSAEAHHLDAYLDEFVFRFNRRSSRNRALLFWRLVVALCETGPLTRAQLATRKQAQAAADDAHADDVLEDERRRNRERVAARRGSRTSEAPTPPAHPSNRDEEPF